MGKTKNARLVFDVSERGIKVEVEGHGYDIVNAIASAMFEDDRIANLLMEGTKKFMLHDMAGRLENNSDALGDIIDELAKDLGIEQEEEVKPKKKHNQLTPNLNAIADLLTEEELASLSRSQNNS